ncbi:hypothetical protein GCM10023185_23610 [Hymenobacter saemangeumensis]|uniref:Gliding motility-associated protein GldM N-terminal domain-containing protein n=1 Tax=Hymenobacter saemangeumensis TaxID=1084522 RepID=A0ABP8IG52_9BACT
MSLRTYLVLALPLAIIGAAAYVFYQQYELQKRLDLQLQELDYTLMERNERNDQAAEHQLRNIQASVVKNQNQASDLTVLHGAESLRQQTKALCEVLHARREDLLRATGNNPGTLLLRHRNATDQVKGYLGPGTAAAQQIHKDIARYKARTRQYYPTDTAQLAFPSLQAVTVVVALAAFSQLEADVLARERRFQQDLAKRVGTKQLLGRLKIMASAESNLVAPGELYRAKLFIDRVLVIENAQMYCNGQPVEMGPDGIGRVSFRAPMQPGRATWKASMRFRINGRDTTFQRLVNYRVARR